MILDLDPGEGTSGETLAGAALAVKAYVENAGLVPFLKTTGGKGFHVVVPLSPEAGWDAVKDFAHTVAADLARDDPDRFTANMNKDVRRGRVYVDYLRNTRGATAVAPYSTRARRGAPVSTPLAWEELSPALKSNHFTVENLPTRLRYLGVDPWAEIDAAARPLPALPDSQAKGQARKASGRRPGTKP
jgi:bifunctional non-homologous end joining protein LigD